MKNKRIDVRSIVTHQKSRLAVAACLILAAVALPLLPELARAGGNGNGIGGSPPQPLNLTTPFLIDASVTGCGFGIYVSFPTGKAGVINLPSGGFLVNQPNTTLLLTNASDPNKSATFQGFSGVYTFSYDQDGNQVIAFTGKGAFYSPNKDFAKFGSQLLIGNWTVVIDPNTLGQLVGAPTGNGQIIDLCALLK